MELMPKQEFGWKWEVETENGVVDLKVFVVRQYAEFVSAQDICANILIGFPELCEQDIINHGEDDFKKFLLRTIYKLTPETIVFPKKYQTVFDEFRASYLKNIENSYLFHSKNRFQELDQMLASVKSAAEKETDPTEIRHLVQMGLNVIKEARSEQSSSKINLQAKSDGDGVTVTATGIPLHGLTDAELEEQKRRYESGERIDIPGQRSLYQMLTQEMARRREKAAKPQKDAIQKLKGDPLYFMSSKEAFIEGAEQFLFIKDKEDKIRPWTCNNTQHMLLNSYFKAKSDLRPVRLVVLKGRQQGCSTGVGAIGFMHMVCHHGANLLIATEEKQGSGKNIFNMYRLYKEKFPIQFKEKHQQDNEIIEFGEDLNFGLIRVSGERRVVSFTYKFIHLSEAAKFLDLDNFMDEMLETVPVSYTHLTLPTICSV